MRIARALCPALAAGTVLAPGAHAALPAGFFRVSTGPAGGAVYVGRIPNHVVADRRVSAVYLPPRFSPARRYPVVYLLHGLPGAPSSFWDSLRIARVADGLIRSRRTAPFIAVMPVGGPVRDPASGEWSGPSEAYLVRDVVPWVDAHLPTVRSPFGRALAGVSAGGYGAMDIGLRHPDLFATLEAWGGYFAPVFADGSLAGAGARRLAANSPVLLVRRRAAQLRRGGTRFFVSTGASHGAVLRRWTLAFSAELTQLRLRHRLWLYPPRRHGGFWRATFPVGLRYAAAGFERSGALHVAPATIPAPGR